MSRVLSCPASLTTTGTAWVLLCASALGSLPDAARAAGGRVVPAENLEDARLDATLQRITTSRGATYVAARDGLVTLGAALLPALERRLARATWSRDTWIQDSMAAIVRAWIREPERCRRLYALDGLESQVYLRGSPARPEVGRELSRARDLAPVLVELWLGGAELYEQQHHALVANASGAVGLTPEERVALRIGVLQALGATAFPAAESLLAEVVADARAADAEREVAAVSLGRLATPRGVRLLTATAADARAPQAVRVAALTGLGRARVPESLDALAAQLTSTADAALFDSALAAVAATGSVWGAAATGAGREAVTARAATLLASVVGLPGIEAHEMQLMEALTVARHPAGLAALRGLAADPGTNAAVRERCRRAIARIERALSRDR